MAILPRRIFNDQFSALQMLHEKKKSTSIVSGFLKFLMRYCCINILHLKSSLKIFLLKITFIFGLECFETIHEVTLTHG